MKSKNIFGFKIRLLIIVMAMFIMFITILMRLFSLQVVNYEKWHLIGERQYRNNNKAQAKRGKILTNDGETVAYDSESYDLVVDPTLMNIEQIDAVVNIISKNVEAIDTAKLKADIIAKQENKRKYLKIKEAIAYDQKIIIETELKLLEQTNHGVFFEKYYGRNYPKEEIYNQVVGFLNSEQTGGYGIEKYYDGELRGKDGMVEVFRNSSNDLSFSFLLDEKAPVEAVDGQNVILTIDSVIQYTLDEELKKAHSQFSAESTMGIVMETETGKILAMSSYPKSKNKSEIKNRTITDLFEPGSIFKPLTVGIALEEKVISPNEVISSEGSIKVKDRIVKDHDGSTTGSFTLEQVIAKSGNVAMVKIVQKLSDGVFYEYLKKLGLDRRSGIDTYFEVAPKFFTLKNMTEVRKSNISFGQGIAMTQLQMITALNTTINGGNMIKPYLVERIEDANGDVKQKDLSQYVDTVFSKETSNSLKNMMESVVVKGTGRGATITGYRIGGKTGTAQKAGSNGYEQGRYVSSFFAFFPVNEPKYTILISINEPKGQYYGAQVALPAVKNLIDKIIKYKGIVPDGEKYEEIQIFETKVLEQKDIDFLNHTFLNGKMPELKGLTLRQFLSVFPTEVYDKFEIVGSGKISQQYPEAGARIDNKTKIKIVLE